MKKLIFLIAFLVPFSFATANEKLKQAKADDVVAKYGCVVTEYVQHFGSVVSPSIIVAGILQESTGNPKAVSHSNAKGLLQVMEKRALAQVRISFPDEKFSDDLFNEEGNIKIAVAYYTYLATMYKDGTVYDYPEAQAVGYSKGPSGGEKIVAKNPFNDSYVKGITDWVKYLPATVCHSS